ncbi:putative E3 ubiquitin-protein ligase BAH1-like 1 [Vitis vinifera]|uniref:RING-type E3 ubiquitin transferase n=1 Tax=Vitis vinifera TaxID=29760 RepID=A0A438II80_VITVI|nr:putative E3 ubiquitin-protein ligase BAH1-like 1 [Vitis vinifera]
MKFGETFMEYLHGEQESFLDKFSHVEYKRLKKVLKTCRSLHGSYGADEQEDENSDALSRLCRYESCPLETNRVHYQFPCLLTDQQPVPRRFGSSVPYYRQTIAEEGRMLIDYVTMNAIAIRKILKKYDKVHSSVNGRDFKRKMQAKHIELLQSPWLIELGAFYLNFNESDEEESCKISCQFSCDLSTTEPVMTLRLPDSMKLECNLTCSICLDTLFNPHALSCGHLFCKSCACSAASVMIFQGLKAASPESKCPICREVSS